MKHPAALLATIGLLLGAAACEEAPDLRPDAVVPSISDLGIDVLTPRGDLQVVDTFHIDLPMRDVVVSDATVVDVADLAQPLADGGGSDDGPPSIVVSEADNLIVNPGFEEAEGYEEGGLGWISWHTKKHPKAEGEHIAEAAGVGGSRGCVIPQHLDALDLAAETEIPRRIVEQLRVPVVGGACYFFRMMIKTDALGSTGSHSNSGARANVYWRDSNDQSIGSGEMIAVNIVGTTPWTAHSRALRAPADAVAFNLHLRVWQAPNVGRASFDDVVVVPAEKVGVTCD